MIEIADAENHPESASWQIGTHCGMAVFSKIHLWRADHTRMRCGARPNWIMGNFGVNHSGVCSRCFK